jgi:hypothetical protein
MAQIIYDRAAVPVGEKIILEAQFRDSAGNVKDTDVFPSIQITDASLEVAQSLTTSGILRTALGRYRFDFIVPDGYTEGMWNDQWVGLMDGYTIVDVFNFTVNSAGSVAATGISVPEPVFDLDDDEIDEPFSQDEIKGILRLRKYLKARLRSTAFKPDGTACPVFDNGQLDLFVCSALSEFNATPTFTAFGFDDLFIQTVAADIITQGAMLIAWAGQAVIEAGFEWTVNDNGVTYNPPPVSSTITTLYSTQLSDYRAKLKEIKRNIRPGPLGLGAGSLLVVNPIFRRLRHRRENRIL